MITINLETAMQIGQAKEIQNDIVSIQEHISYIQRLVAQGGPREADYAGFDAWVKQIHALRESGQISIQELAAVRSTFGEAFSPATIQGFVFTKPHGYAGDYEVMDRIYQAYICPLQHLSAWDYYMQQQSAVKAVRNRKTYFQNILDKYIARWQPLHVLKVGSGPGRSMLEWLCSHQAADIHFDCIESDANAIHYASELNHNFVDRITFIQKNALRYRPHAQYELVWAAGIFDYFDDKVFVSLLERLLLAAAPGGELIVGNFSVDNPSRAYMELGDWFLYHRSADKLVSLAQSVGVPQERISIHSEPLGVNLFLHIKMP